MKTIHRLIMFVFLVISALTILGNGIYGILRNGIFSATPAQEQVPDLNNAQWLILGPFANPPAEGDVWWDYQGFHRDYLEEAGGEIGACFENNQIILNKKVIPVVAKNGVVDLLRLYPNSDNTVAYAYLEFASYRAQKVALKLGSDDGIKVWLNDTLIWANHSHRMVIPDEDAVAVHLKPGINRMLVKIEQAGGDWGFVARIRSLADEAFDWKKEKKPTLKVVLPDTVITNKNQAWCVVNSMPAFVVPEPVTLLVNDGDGNKLTSIKGRIGEPIVFHLPEEYEGIINIQAIGEGRLADLKGPSPETLALVGDYRKLTANSIAEARALSKNFIYDAQSEDVGATLTFLGDQLAGEHHQSLITPERNLRAIQTIANIKKVLEAGSWQTGTLRNIRQWAYRSAIDDSCQPYTIYLPESYNPKNKYHLVLALHGVTRDDYHAVKTICDYHQPDDFIIAGTFGRGDMGYRSFAEQDVLDVLDRVQKIYNIDPDRVYMMGESMGGLGTWRIGQFYADHFAAIAPFCGWTGMDYLENLRNLPVLIVHGDKDQSAPPSLDEAAANWLIELSYDCHYQRLPGAGHNAWNVFAETYGGEAIFTYFRKHRRNPWPKEVNLRINYLRYARQYWVRINELTSPLTPGSVHAVVKNPREIKIETNGISSLTFDLRHPKLKQQGIITICIDNQSLTVTAGQANSGLNFSKNLGWQVIDQSDVLTKIAPHLGGGIADLLHGPIIFVYGTQQPERSEILKATAEKVTSFSITPQIEAGTKVGLFMIKADTEISEAELQKSNLFLLGNADENLITAALTDRLGNKFPVRLIGDDLIIGEQEFKASGLALTYPNPWAPKYLTAILTLPFDQGTIKQFTEYLNLPFRYASVDKSAIEDFILPDVIAIRSLTEEASLSWSFDQEWKELIPVEWILQIPY